MKKKRVVVIFLLCVLVSMSTVFCQDGVNKERIKKERVELDLSYDNTSNNAENEYTKLCCDQKVTTLESPFRVTLERYGARFLDLMITLYKTVSEASDGVRRRVYAFFNK